MAIIPIKVLKDKNQEAFLPFTITDAVFIPDTNKTITDALEEQEERIDEAIESVPTKTSDLTNDSNFVSDANYVHTDNNYTDSEKSKLAGIAAGAEANVLEKVKVNGTEQTITNKAVDITVPTKVSDIDNDLSFIDNTVNNLVNYYTKTEVDNKVSSVYKYQGSVNTYADLPSSGQVVGDVYNVVTADTTHGIPAGGNVAWNGTAWDYLGGDIDFSNYYTKAQVDTSLNGKVDKVTGKQLSTEDYTSAEKTKLANIEANAAVNLIESISVNNTTVSPVNKNVNIPIKTINNESLLGTGNIDTSSGGGTWGNIGGTLSNQTDLQDALDAKQDTLVSGTNIKTINNQSILGSGNISISSDESTVMIKEVLEELPSDTTNYSEGDKVYIVNDNDNLLYTLVSGVWTNPELPDVNKLYLILNRSNVQGLIFTPGIYKVDTSDLYNGYIVDKLSDYKFLNDLNDIYYIKSGTYLAETTGVFTYYERYDKQNGYLTNGRGISYQALSTVSAYKADDSTFTVGDIFVVNDPRNIVILTLSSIDTTTSTRYDYYTWDIKQYNNPVKVIKSTDVEHSDNLYYIFQSERFQIGASTSLTDITRLWLVDNTFTLTYTSSITGQTETFTFDRGDRVTGNSRLCISGVPMIVEKANGKRYKITDLTVAGSYFGVTEIVPVCATQPTSNDELANKAYVDAHAGGTVINGNVTAPTDTTKVTTSTEMFTGKYFIDDDGLKYPIYTMTWYVPKDSANNVSTSQHYAEFIPTNNFATGFSSPTGLKRLFVLQDYSCIRTTYWDYPFSRFDAGCSIPTDSTVSANTWKNIKGSAVGYYSGVQSNINNRALVDFSVGKGLYDGMVYARIVIEYTKIGEGVTP